MIKQPINIMKILSAIFIGVLAFVVVAGYQETDLRTLLDALKQREDSGDAPAINTNKKGWTDARDGCEANLNVKVSQLCRREDIQQLDTPDAFAFLKRELVQRDLYHECCVEQCDAEEIEETC
ncbi:uncharacterized protein [Amphiura filiformis]|uniref:uncharacterized protein n=1 Tax=Amphiura filiformis TaxID=82378 RepID=UPI003B22317E